MFKTGTCVIYPHYGAGEIVDTETVEVDGEEKKYYVVEIYLRDLTVRFPEEQIEERNIRTLVSKNNLLERLREVRERILEEDYPDGEIQKVQRSRLEQMESNIKEGDLDDTIDALARLHAKFVERDMNIGEKRTYDLAKEFCTGELMGIHGCDADSARDKLSNYLPLHIPNLHDPDEEEESDDEDEEDDE